MVIVGGPILSLRTLRPNTETADWTPNSYQCMNYLFHKGELIKYLNLGIYMNTLFSLTLLDMICSKLAIMNSSKEVLYEHIAVNKPTRLLLFVVFGVLVCKPIP